MRLGGAAVHERTDSLQGRAATQEASAEKGLYQADRQGSRKDRTPPRTAVMGVPLWGLYAHGPGVFGARAP